jgi:hypothetical protein
MREAAIQARLHVRRSGTSDSPRALTGFGAARVHASIGTIWSSSPATVSAGSWCKDAMSPFRFEDPDDGIEQGFRGTNAPLTDCLAPAEVV